MQLRRQVTKLGVLMVLLSTLAACGGKLTQENFDKVTINMPAKDVKGLLGEPSQVDTVTVPVVGTVTKYTYKNEKGEVAILLQDDKVKSKIGSIGK